MSVSLPPIHSFRMYRAPPICQALYQRPGNRGVADTASALPTSLLASTVAVRADGVLCKLHNSLPQGFLPGAQSRWQCQGVNAPGSSPHSVVPGVSG